MTQNRRFASQPELAINLDALIANWQFFKDLGNAEVSAVVKANAYGLGIEKCALALHDAGCNIFFVAHLSEGIVLRKMLSWRAKIYVLNGFIGGEIQYFREYDLIPVLNNFEQIQSHQDQKTPCAIHIDTGMNRLGIRFDEAEKCEKLLAGQSVEMIMSHLACASEPAHTLNDLQLVRFRQICDLFPNAQKSLSASAGALIGPKYHFDLLRPGIGLYGSNPNDNPINPMRPVLTLRAPIIQLRELKSGEAFGYGATFTASKTTKIAVIALGYADGFLRSASNSGFAVIDGVKCPIIGRVSMDLIALDIRWLNYWVQMLILTNRQAAWEQLPMKY
ncbi:MAG: alanine racemase [Hyphomonadaceae bacterium]|nr:MAG: alanine racemase [Hyphomonadaceae bacterium]